MKFGAVAGVLVLFAVFSCGPEARDFGMRGDAGSTDQGGENSAGSDNSAASPSAGVGGGGSAGTDGGVGAGPGGADAGAAGVAGGTMQPPDLCVGKVCDTPPAEDCLNGTQFQTYDKIGSCDAGTCSYTPHVISCTCMDKACTTDPCLGLTCDTPPAALCKDPSTVTNYAKTGTCDAGSCSYAPADTDCPFGCANGACKTDPCANVTCSTPPASTCKDAGTRTTYAASGTCTDGTCGYAATNPACAGATPKCKDLGTSSKCVACLGNNDCSNGATCSAAGACVCSNRFNGPHCEFQVFRGLGALAGDATSVTFNISHDGSVVVGGSYRAADGFAHAVRSVNGGALQFIAEPASLTPSTGCHAAAVDSSGAVLLYCEGSTFLHTSAGSDVAITGGVAVDLSLDGKVIVGVTSDSPSQAFRKVGSVTTPLGVLDPAGSSDASATNGDGSVVVGKASLAGGGYGAVRWTAATGLVALPRLVNWYNPDAFDVSTDGKVIVGEALDPNNYVAVKWSGAALSAAELGAGHALCTNGDGSVVGGSDNSSAAMLWDGAGAHTVKTLLGATSDLTGWSLENVVGISDDGKFLVGNGTHGTTTEGWVAHLP